MADEQEARAHPFSRLTPDLVLQSMEELGFRTDGRLLALNSYENRVYQVGIDDEQPLIVKFYRPGRWSREQIQEEHDFVYELEEQELPVVAPLSHEGQSLLESSGFMLAAFARRGGRAPELDNPDNLYSLGQALGRMHRVGQAQSFKYRPGLTVQSYGVESCDFVARNFIPASLADSYRSLCDHLLEIIAERFEQADQVQFIRCHADCHIGNILWRDDSPNFVDFDDARSAPAIQDLWMLLSGYPDEQSRQMQEILEGYEMFQPFNLAELRLVEPLRTLRMMHHCAWLARRWDDPAFPRHFSWFNTERYWGEHILELREQLGLLQDRETSAGPRVFR